MSTADPAELREEFVARLTASGHLQTREIIDAFRTVKRHTFVPDADPATAYGEGTVPIKDAPDDGETISCISAPSIVATQLEQLAPQPGQRVLEAGAATGYNAALLGRLVGPGGHVWTVDVDEDLVSGAAANLEAAGIENVTALQGDGAAGLPEQAPFDRIQFTVGAGDIPTRILDQLAPGGRLVIVYLGPDWILEQLQPRAAATAPPLSGTQLAFPVQLTDEPTRTARSVALSKCRASAVRADRDNRPRRD